MEMNGNLMHQSLDTCIHRTDSTEQFLIYEGVTKSPRTMLITRKSLVIHEFPARVCCGGVL